MSQFFKKNWFICIIAAALIGVSVFYVYDTNKDVLRGKSSGGEDVVYEVAGQDVTVSQLYDELYEAQGIAGVYRLFEKSVLSQGVETTDEMTQLATINAANIISNYQSYYGTSYETVLTQALQQVGYSSIDDLEEYMLQYQKSVAIAADYAKANTDELQIRNISYILIQFEDSSNPSADGEPTEDEQARMDAVDAAFANGDDFATVAANFSEDSSTASTGGILGTLDKNTSSIDEAFLSASLSMTEGDISDWVYSFNFGYFKIMVNASTVESLEAIENSDGSNAYEELVSNYDTTLTMKALWAKAEELGLDFGDNTELEAQLKEYMGLTEGDE